MTFATIILVILALMFLGVLPVWPFSRDWGYAPAIFIGGVLVVLLTMALTGRVPGVASGW
jgi:hypothetical protein